MATPSGAPSGGTTLTGAQALKQLRDNFARIVANLNGDDIIRRLCDVAINMIRHRTNQGLDVNGQPFAPYSATWAKVRRDAGLPAAPVNLTVSGTMAGAIFRIVETPRRGVLRVRGVGGGGNSTPRDRVALGHQLGAGIAPQREFMGLSDSERVALTREAARLLVEQLMSASPAMTASGNEISVIRTPYKMRDTSAPTVHYSRLRAARAS